MTEWYIQKVQTWQKYNGIYSFDVILRLRVTFLLLFLCSDSSMSLSILLCYTVNMQGLVSLTQHNGIGWPQYTEPHHCEHESNTESRGGLLHTLNTVKGEQALYNIYWIIPAMWLTHTQYLIWYGQKTKLYKFNKKWGLSWMHVSSSSIYVMEDVIQELELGSHLYTQNMYVFILRWNLNCTLINYKNLAIIN